MFNKKYNIYKIDEPKVDSGSGPLKRLEMDLGFFFIILVEVKEENDEDGCLKIVNEETHNV